MSKANKTQTNHTPKTPAAVVSAPQTPSTAKVAPAAKAPITVAPVAAAPKAVTTAPAAIATATVSAPISGLAVTVEHVARRAFELFEARGGQHGHAEQDWLQAERELGFRKP